MINFTVYSADCVGNSSNCLYFIMILLLGMRAV